MYNNCLLEEHFSNLSRKMSWRLSGAVFMVMISVLMNHFGFQSAEAETTYKACVAEANHRQRSLEKVKVRGE